LNNHHGAGIVAVCVFVRPRKDHPVRFLGLVLIWCVLFVLSWPLALAVLILAPLVWLISLPLRLVGISVAAAFALLKSILFLPARLLGYRE
jgi:hypothetical protein